MKRRRQPVGFVITGNERVIGVYANDEFIVVIVHSPQGTRLVCLPPDRLPPELAELVPAKSSLDDLFLRKIQTIAVLQK